MNLVTIRRYILRRLLLLVPQLLGISLVVFVMMRVIPGDPVAVILGPFLTDETAKATQERLGLDKPLPVQYVYYMRNILQGDLGRSFTTRNAVTSDLAERLPATLELSTVSIVLACLLGIPAGVVSAFRRGAIPDRVLSSLSVIGMSVPVFWLGLILIFVFFHLLGWFPAPVGRIGLGVTPPGSVTGFYLVDSLLAGNWTAFKSSLQQIMPPVLTLFWIPLAPILKATRSSTLSMLGADYVELSHLMGLPRIKTLTYVVRGALPPVVTMIGILYSLSIGGSVLVERVFGWPGMGDYAAAAVFASDYAPVQAFILLTATFVVVLTLFIDVLYVFIDPRIRYQ